MSSAFRLDRRTASVNERVCGPSFDDRVKTRRMAHISCMSGRAAPARGGILRRFTDKPPGLQELCQLGSGARPAFFRLTDLPTGYGLVVGNCQAESLRIVLENGDRPTVRVPPIHELTLDDTRRLHESPAIARSGRHGRFPRAEATIPATRGTAARLGSGRDGRIPTTGISRP